jgi:hypothetical protein
MQSDLDIIGCEARVREDGTLELSGFDIEGTFYMWGEPLVPLVDENDEPIFNDGG